jgi:hypothetical protein
MINSDEKWLENHHVELIEKSDKKDYKFFFLFIGLIILLIIFDFIKRSYKSFNYEERLIDEEYYQY